MTTRMVTPLRCKMWELHDRMGEFINEKSCANLIDSIRKHGQKQPVLARPISGVDAFEYELIYGARRLFAARYLGIDLLIEVRQFDNRAALVEMDIENRVRTDITPYERGRSYRRWLNSGYFSNQCEMAKALAVSEAQVSRLLRYAELPTVVVEAFQSPGEIREEWAVNLAKACADPEERSLLIRRARNVKRSAGAPTSRAVFEGLMNGRKPGRPSTGQVRDDIVKDSDGRSLFRVRFRTQNVHLVIPRAVASPVLLGQINEQVRRILSQS